MNNPESRHKAANRVETIGLGVLGITASLGALVLLGSVLQRLFS